MEIKEISETQYKRTVLKNIKYKSPLVMQGAAVGNDCAVVKVGEKFIATSTVQMMLKHQSEVKVLAARGLNAISTVGASSKSVMIEGMLPKDYDERQIKQLVALFSDIFEEYKVEISRADFVYYDLLKEYPIISLSILGETECGKRAEVCPGDEIVMTKSVAIEACYRIFLDKEKELLKRFQKSYVKSFENYGKQMYVVPEAAVAVKHGVTAMLDLSEGGIFAGLWKLSAKAGLGLCVNANDIPIEQNTVEICEIFDLNPYELPSAGSMLIIGKDAKSLKNKLNEAGIEAKIIGKMSSDNDKIIILSNGTKRHLDLPKSGNLETIF